MEYMQSKQERLGGTLTSGGNKHGRACKEQIRKRKLHPERNKYVDNIPCAQHCLYEKKKKSCEMQNLICCKGSALVSVGAVEKADELEMAEGMEGKTSATTMNSCTMYGWTQT